MLFSSGLHSPKCYFCPFKNIKISPSQKRKFHLKFKIPGKGKSVPLLKLHAIRRLDVDLTFAHFGPVGGEDSAATLLKRLVHRASGKSFNVWSWWDNWHRRHFYASPKIKLSFNLLFAAFLYNLNLFFTAINKYIHLCLPIVWKPNWLYVFESFKSIIVWDGTKNLVGLLK